ncbi:metallophosphoesterase family protein [Gemmata sp. JC717]|uniref:metallophosphoesterase family protein n=1 Tax=Gemmata algarum TaxID=2975278 RepID=UPI0021BB17C8|nr:metallophosphoesterase family protein [Gemmata algarum]MDY3555396.1 metallophosphoesterase family protein [Gemmata algarum]
MRVLAIGDVHGCLGHLDDLLAWVAPAATDELIFLGDYVDRGPDTRGVLNRLIELKQKRPVVCLRGNHEVMMLEARFGSRSDRKQWLSVGGVQALGSYGPALGVSGTFDDVPGGHWEFLEYELVPYHETDRFIFVHAGVDHDAALDDQPDNMLYWEFLPEAMRHRSGKQVICGHSSQRSGLPKVIPGAVCIDTHAYGGGWLTCLDALSGRYWQVDVIGRKREGRVDYEE